MFVSPPRSHARTYNQALGASPVRRGTKVVLQRWYSYLEQPFLAARPVPELPPQREARVPFQPLVSCDYVHGSEVNVSCRWYNSDACSMGYCRPG